MVWLFLTGQYNEEETARIIGVTVKTLATHVKAYLEGGLEVLSPQYGNNWRPRRLSPAQEEDPAHTVATKFTSELGFENLANWTLAPAVAYTRKKGA